MCCKAQGLEEEDPPGHTSQADTTDGHLIPSLTLASNLSLFVWGMGTGLACSIHCEDLFTSIIFKQLFKGRIKVSQEYPASRLLPESQVTTARFHAENTAPPLHRIDRILAPGILPI